MEIAMSPKEDDTPLLSKLKKRAALSFEDHGK